MRSPARDPTLGERVDDDVHRRALDEEPAVFVAQLSGLVGVQVDAEPPVGGASHVSRRLWHGPPLVRVPVCKHARGRAQNGIKERPASSTSVRAAIDAVGSPTTSDDATSSLTDESASLRGACSAEWVSACPRCRGGRARTATARLAILF